MASLAQRRHALQAADELLNDLDIDQTEPVDVFGIIDRLGLWLAFNPLHSLLGATLPKGQGGIMLTTRRGPSVQRYTAAHEIGHWVMDVNDPAFDTDDDIYHPTTDRELLAQLFAGQLLMPPPLVFETCARYGITSDDTATGSAVYLTARDMGASYEAAVRQLANLEIVSLSTRDTLLTHTRAQIKAELCHGHRPRGAVDVWPVDLRAAGGDVNVIEGDEVVIILPENRTTGYRWMTDDEISERASRQACPPPEPFGTVQPHTTGEPIPPQTPSNQRTAAEVKRALTRVPGNAGARRILRKQSDTDEAAAVDPDHVSRSALEAIPASLGQVEDRFTAGWARLAPSRMRAVRRAIAGRHDVQLPEALQSYVHSDAVRTEPVLAASTIPAAATGERLVALRSAGVGSLSLELAYTSATDPHAPAALTFHLNVHVGPTPELRRRRQLLESGRTDDNVSSKRPDQGEEW